MKKLKIALILMSCSVFNPILVHPAKAGVFNIPEFVDPGNWAVGLEPEATFNSGGSFSTNLKFTYGLAPISNLQFGIGEGSGNRGFRIGGTYTFDFIPDLKGQIGAGIALQLYYYKIQSGLSQTEASIYPYLHKAFENGGWVTSYDPYVALPLGIGFVSGTYHSLLQLVLGSAFRTSQYFSLNGELGINLSNTDTYIAGGITYRN